MKRLLIIVSLVCVSAIQATGLGWRIHNSTHKTIVLAWYETALSSLGYPTGTKSKISNVGLLKPGEERFVSMPPVEPARGWFGAKTSHELIFTSERDYDLPELIEAGASGVPSRSFYKNSLLITDSKKLDVAPYKITKEGRPTVFLLPTQTNTQGFKVALEQVAHRGMWHIDNKTGKLAYYAWYEAEWNSINKMYTNPRLMGGQKILELAAKTKIALEIPHKQRKGTRRYLMFSFDKRSLKHPIDTNIDHNFYEHVSMYSRKQLGKEESHLSLVSVGDRPLITASHQQVRLINTTNEPLYGAFYYVDTTKRDKASRATGELVCIAPQMYKELNYPLAASEKDIQLFIARDGDKQLLEKSILFYEEFLKLTRKSFKESDVTHWFGKQPFNIVYDPTNPQSYYLRIYPVGGTITGSSVERLLDFAAFDPGKIRDYEQLLKNYEPSETIKQAAVKQDCSPIIVDRNNLELEQSFIKERTDVVRKAINELFKNEGGLLSEHQDVPKIALVFTGGGYRAMVETIGYLRAAESTGVNAVVFSSQGSALLNSGTVKSSAGAIYNITICRSDNLKNTIDFLKNSGLKIISATE